MDIESVRANLIHPDHGTPEQAKFLRDRGGDNPSNLFRMFANNVPLFEALGPLSSYVFTKSTLQPRHREIIILRCAWVAKAEYQWALHRPLARRAGLTDAEIDRIKLAPGATGWSGCESALIAAVDEIRRNCMIGEATWQSLARELSTEQMFDVIFVAGQTLMIAAAINSLPMPMDAGLIGFG
jgi:4-carboxymuconolactone decarboxylase